ncbi:hypothetical protein M1403_01115 [Patescibacteria group bacterium]|nr:hypothetical protein [Patescibacteria group bacterium]
MKNKLPVLIVLLLVVVGGFLVWQKSQAKPAIVPKPEVTETGIKKVDLSTQPEWVQKLVVTAKKGRSANGLDNFTLTAKGIDPTVKTLTYVVQYETSNKGTQGALVMKPQEVTNGTYTQVIDLGTCSTKSCVRNDGVTSVEIELDFSDGSIWTGTISL